MSKELCVERASTLFKTKRAELREARERGAAVITGKSNRDGMLHSGNHMLAMDRHYRDSMKVAATMAWETLEETHRALGKDLGDDMRQALKTWMGDSIRSLRGE